MKYIVITYRNFNDFKFGTMKLEMNSKGESVISGKLKKKNSISFCKYQEIKNVN